MMQIRCKQDNNFAIQHQLLGNSVRTWLNKDELAASGFDGLLGIRDIRPGGLFESPRTVREALASTREGIYFSEYIPVEYITIQGELCQSDKHLTFFYTYVKEQMRYALKSENRHAYGLDTLGLLKRYLSPASYEDVQELLDVYPGHIIEFTALNRDFGPCRGRNAVIWEVRAY